MNNEEIALKWKQVGDRWIADLIEGDAKQGRFEVAKNAQGWKLVWMFDEGDSPVISKIVATFEQAKQLAERWKINDYGDSYENRRADGFRTLH